MVYLVLLQLGALGLVVAAVAPLAVALSLLLETALPTHTPIIPVLVVPVVAVAVSVVGAGVELVLQERLGLVPVPLGVGLVLEVVPEVLVAAPLVVSTLLLLLLPLPLALPPPLVQPLPLLSQLGAPTALRWWEPSTAHTCSRHRTATTMTATVTRLTPRRTRPLWLQTAATRMLPRRPSCRRRRWRWRRHGQR